RRGAIPWGLLGGSVIGGRGAMSLVRRVSAAVLVAAMFGWLSTLAPQDGELRLTAAQNKAPAAGSEAPRAGSETPGTGDGASAAGSEAPKPKPPRSEERRVGKEWRSRRTTPRNSKR